VLAIPTDADGHLNGDMVFPTMVTTLMPTGLRGMLVAGLLSALMSSLAIVRVGRFATGVVVILGIIWIPVMKLISGGGLYQYLQSVQGYLAPPITATFLLGLFFKRINARGALAGLVLGFILGMVKLTLQAMDGGGAFGDSGLLHAIGSYNFLYAGGWLFLISIVIVVGVSLTAPAPSAKQIEGLTYTSLTAAQREENRRSWGAPEVLGSLGVVAMIVGIYLYFSFWLG